MATTKIEWTDRVWNPVTGCAKVSEGCRNCYAKALHDMRHKAYLDGKKMPDQYAVPFEQVLCHENRLNDPFHWKKPSRVFVNSMSDLFHPDVPAEFILRVWITMALANRHTFIILSKRPDRMQNLLTHWMPGAFGISTLNLSLMKKPLKNVWLGVSVEDQKTADERIPLLLQTPAAMRLVSVEPMLGPIDLGLLGTIPHSSPYALTSDKLHWVICGGESGPKARPMHPDWARSLRDQCQAADVPFFFKQWGEWALQGESDAKAKNFGVIAPDSTWYEKHTGWNGRPSDPDTGEACMRLVGKKAAGRLLDGREWNEFPEVKNVQPFAS
jgi:protein gp37